MAVSCRVCSTQKHCFAKLFSAAFLLDFISVWLKLSEEEHPKKKRSYQKVPDSVSSWPARPGASTAGLSVSRGRRRQASKTEAAGDCYLVRAGGQVTGIFHIAAVWKRKHVQRRLSTAKWK